MPRQARQISETGFYHIVFRGVNHCNLFEEQEDFERMLHLLANVKSELDLAVPAYCLMDNHVHLLIQEQAAGDVILAMRKLLGPYAYWFNRKYGRSGALIANRYRSSCVESDEYLLTLVRYIHQNPLVAGIAGRIENYRWSSYGDYVKKTSSLTDTQFILQMFSSDHEAAINGFIDFHKTLESKDLSFSGSSKKAERTIHEEATAALGGVEPHSISGMPRNERDSALTLLRRSGFSIRQIERATGVSRNIIAKNT